MPLPSVRPTGFVNLGPSTGWMDVEGLVESADALRDRFSAAGARICGERANAVQMPAERIRNLGRPDGRLASSLVRTAVRMTGRFRTAYEFALVEDGKLVIGRFEASETCRREGPRPLSSVRPTGFVNLGPSTGWMDVEGLVESADALRDRFSAAGARICGDEPCGSSRRYYPLLDWFRTAVQEALATQSR